MRLSDTKLGHKITDIQITDLNSLKTKNPGVPLPKGGTAVRMGGQSIVTVEVPKTQNVQTFEPGKIKDSRGVRYSDVLTGVKDPGEVKNARFRINELTRGPLSVEAEEEARIEGEIQARLAERLDAIRTEISKTAHKEGYEAGLNQGKQEVMGAAKPMLEQFEKLIVNLDGMGAEIFKANEEFVMRMVYQLARSVILKEVKEDKDYVKRLIAHLIERVGTRENIKLFVDEKEFSSAEQLKQGLAQNLGELKNISIELDPEVAKGGGGCRLETEFGEIDARIETQIRNMAQALGTQQS